MFEVVEKFPRFVEKYTHYTGKVEWKFYYKREAMLSKGDERKTKDPSAIKLLYSEVTPATTFTLLASFRDPRHSSAIPYSLLPPFSPS